MIIIIITIIIQRTRRVITADGVDDSLTARPEVTYLTVCSHCNEAVRSLCREQCGRTSDISNRRR